MIQKIKHLIVDFLSNHIPLSALKNVLPEKFILYGHLVTNKKHYVSKYYQYPTRNEFDKLIHKFLKFGYRFVSLSEYLVEDNQKKIHLTFDDGFKSIHDDLHPYMQVNNIPYTIFILTDPLWNADFYIRSIKDYDTSIRTFLSIEEILKLKDQGVHIGFHTRSHLKIEDYHSISDEEIVRELTIPKQYLYLFSEPLCFAYPYLAPANFRTFNEFMVGAGYKYFFDTKGFINNNANHFFRVSIDAEKTVFNKNWVEFNVKRQLLPKVIHKII